MSAESLIIKRSELGLTDLQLQAPNQGFYIYGQTEFTRPTQERTYATPVPWVAYEHITHSRPTNGSYTIRVPVSGANAAQLKQRIAAVEAAFCDQIRFTIQHTLGGITETWNCGIADMAYDSVDRDWDAVRRSEFKQQIIFTGPHRGRI